MHHGRPLRTTASAAMRAIGSRPWRAWSGRQTVQWVGATAACYRSAAVRVSVDGLRRWAAPTASTSPLSRGLCRAHRWVHSTDQVLDSPLDDLFECSNTSRSCHRPGAKMGSHPAKSRQESGGVWTVICPGKQHFANLLDSSRPARGLLHTEEVTGSIPVSPTQLSGRFRLGEPAVLILVQQQSAEIGSNKATSPGRATVRACRAPRGWRPRVPRCRSPW